MDLSKIDTVMRTLLKAYRHARQARDLCRKKEPFLGTLYEAGKEALEADDLISEIEEDMKRESKRMFLKDFS